MDHTLHSAAIANQEGTTSTNGLLTVRSGRYTARYASAKYIVPPKNSTRKVAYNQYHQTISAEHFSHYWHIASQHTPSLTSCRYQVGNHPHLNISVQVETELYWHQLFAEHLFLPQTNSPLEHWTLRCIPSLQPSEQHPVFIGINPDTRQVLICGTGYAGEIKKAMFSVMNFLLPEHNVLSMHCSAVLSPHNTCSLLLGLSGTGKTTLSASKGLKLIGDDEHAWCDDGIFNLEGGCYAKAIRLSKTEEPQIYQALSPPAILENVVLDSGGNPDFFDDSITENLRAAYPLNHIVNHSSQIAPHPSDIIFLCCDLYGVIPAVSWLTPKQAIEFFMIGYTAKIGATEVSLSSVQPVSSPCFGHPFFARELSIYQQLLAHRVKQHKSRVWLVNTGWGEGGYQNGKRIPLQKTRGIIHAITHQAFHAEQFELHPSLGLRYPNSIASVGNTSLSKSWLSHPDFEVGCQQLKALFDQTLSHV